MKGQAKKMRNKRTQLIQSVLQSRYKELAGAIQAAKEVNLDLDGLEKLKSGLGAPVKLSGTLFIQIEDCHPSSGRYKHALPKGYQKAITAVNKAIIQAQALSSVKKPGLEKIKEESHSEYDCDSNNLKSVKTSITISTIEGDKSKKILSKLLELYDQELPRLEETILIEKNRINGEIKEEYSDYEALLKKKCKLQGCDLLKLPSHEKRDPIAYIKQEVRDRSALVMYGKDFYFANKNEVPIEIEKVYANEKTDEGIKEIEDIFNSINSNYRTATDDEVKKIRGIFRIKYPLAIVPLYKDKKAIDDQLNNDLSIAKVSLRISSERVVDINHFCVRIKKIQESKSNDAIIIPGSNDITYEDIKAFSGLIAIKSMSSSSENEKLFIKALKEQFDPILHARKDERETLEKYIPILPEEKQFATNFINDITSESRDFYAYAHKIINVIEKPKDVEFSPLEQKISNNLIYKIKSELVDFEKNNTPNAKNIDQLKEKISSAVENKMREIELNKVPVSDGWKGFINAILSAIGFSKKCYEAPVSKYAFSELKRIFTFEKPKHENKEEAQQPKEGDAPNLLIG